MISRPRPAHRRWIRWNAAVTVHRAQRPGIGVGGHISTYASSASLYEVGFNHFFRGLDDPNGGDQILLPVVRHQARVRVRGDSEGSLGLLLAEAVELILGQAPLEESTRR
jgi:hypothetical protein